MELKRKEGMTEVWSVDDARTPNYVKKRLTRESSHSDDEITASVISHTKKHQEMGRKIIFFRGIAH